MTSTEKPQQKSCFKKILIVAASTLLFSIISTFMLLPILSVFVLLFTFVGINMDGTFGKALSAWVSMFIDLGCIAYIAAMITKKWQPDIKNLYFLLAFCAPTLLDFLGKIAHMHGTDEKIGMGSDILSLIAIIFFWNLAKKQTAGII